MFDHKEILTYFKGVRVGNSPFGVCYIFSNTNGSDFMELIVFNNKYKFIIDNYPRQRKFFDTDIPYRNMQDFESDLERMDIKLIKNE